MFSSVLEKANPRFPEPKLRRKPHPRVAFAPKRRDTWKLGKASARGVAGLSETGRVGIATDPGDRGSGCRCARVGALVKETTGPGNSLREEAKQPGEAKDRSEGSDRSHSKQVELHS